ncbi:YitT family protein [Fulvivirga sp. M361]|uniref:YitT family protein n=1 Tax=Fulvivirga sp. M361 TaxID=2594266 RepID=UPI00117AC09E|nr:YitT family protein [Fulvivirga sp. M361]TRX58238.1 YitT family protein [Fulvivirga sp. M361]
MNDHKNTSVGRAVVEILWVLAGVFSAAFGLKGFLLPNNFIDGGATGISLLIAETTILDISYVILVVNIPFIIIGYLQMSRKFVLKTTLAVVLLSVVLALLEFPIITEDTLLAAVFGGFFLGAGIGLSVRGGCVIDGTEILALYFSRLLNVSMGDIIILINLVIFGVAAWLLSVELALYSILTYFVASKTMDFIIQGIEEYLGLTIISTQSDEIKQIILEEMNTGVTVLNGRGGYGQNSEGQEKIDVLYTVVTRLELLKINRIVDDTDPAAFVVIHGVRDVKGGMLKKRKVPH